MNKDMINIDDFVREKLGAHSEEQNPAAWFKMKALLDKEMPERVVPVGFRYGKQLAALAVVLLVGALCVGSYQQLSSVRHASRAASAADQATQAVSANSTASATNPANLATNAAPIGQAQLRLHKQDPVIEDAKANAPHSAGLIQPKMAQHYSAQAVAQVASNTPLNKRLVAQGKLQPNITIAQNKQTDAQAKGLKYARNIVKADAVSTATTSSTKDLPKAMRQQQTEVFASNTQQKTATTPVEPTRADMETAKVKTAATRNKKTIPTPTMSTQPKVNELNSIRTEETHSDTMLATTIVTKELTTKGYPRKVVRIVDTIAKDKIVLGNNNSAAQKTNGPTPPPQKKYRSSTNEAAPTAVTAQSSTHNNTQLNSQPKQVASTQKHVLASLLQQLNLPAAIANAKSDMRNAQFYWGFNGGLNYTYSNSINFKGIQFGPTGELVFNKHWSLFGAINYFNRSGSKKTVNDNFYSQKTTLDADSTKGANYYFTVSSDSTNRYFNFSTVHSFELPLAVRYAFKKLYLMGGINLAYYLRVNVEKVEKQYNNVNPHVVVVNTTRPILNATFPMLNSADFGSRFGVGYIFGLGYQISPSWQADLRMSTLFWDNAKGTGAQTLSDAFYRLPSVQISLGYQFNRSGLRTSFGPTP
jgi:hypothetical protein